jgi:hypothetical protein
MWTSDKKRGEIKDAVEHCLKHKPETRDNDYLLIREAYERMGHLTAFMTGYTMFTYIADGRMPSIETIGRWRRRLQQRHPEYRGRVWADRHAYTEEVKGELGYGK